MDLKKEGVNSAIWVTIERFGLQGAEFIISLILARLLTPKEFGLVALIYIVVAFFRPFIDSGFGKTLVQKKEVTSNDYDTAFWINIGVSIVLYLAIFLSAEFIATFYEQAELVNPLRVISLVLIFQSFMIVPNAILTRKFNFKKITVATILGVILSGVVSITMAINGYSYWSLVWKYIIQFSITSIILLISVKWYPSLNFSTHSFKALWGFGSKLLLSNFLETGFNQIYPLIIGKRFSPASLAFYNRAKGTKDVPVMTINGILQKISFPLFSKIQDDEKRLASIYTRLLHIVAFLCCGIFFLLFAVSDELVVFLFTEKWKPMTLYFQLLLFVGLLFPLQGLNLNLVLVKGRSDLFLKIEVIKKVLAIAALLLTVWFSITVMIIGQILVSLFTFFISTYYSDSFLGLSFRIQLKIIAPYLIFGTIASCISYFVGFDIKILWILLSVKLFVGGITYFLLNFLTKQEGLNDLVEIVNHFLKRIQFKKFNYF